MSFNFRIRMLKLNIAGNEFEIETDAAFNERSRRIGHASKGTGEAFKAEEITEREAIDTFKGYINEMLCEEKAFEKIFANRSPDLRDCVDVLLYITDETTAFIEANTVIVNRAQRRAARS